MIQWYSYRLKQLHKIVASSIQCPEDDHTSTVNMLTIMSKVRIEAFMWVSHQAFIQNIMKHVKSLNQAFGSQFHDKNPAKMMFRLIPSIMCFNITY